MSGKTIKYSFNILCNTVIIGFTDDTWIAFGIDEDYETGSPSIRESFILNNLPEYLIEFHWDIVSEFEKSGILKDTVVLREILRRKAIENIDNEIDRYSGRFDFLKQEKARLEKGELYEKEEK